MEPRIVDEEGEVTRELWERLTTMPAHTGRVVVVSLPPNPHDWIRRAFVTPQAEDGDALKGIINGVGLSVTCFWLPLAWWLLS